MKVFSKRKVKFGIIFTWLFAPALLMPFFFNNGFSWVGSVLILIAAIPYDMDHIIWSISHLYYRYIDPVWLMIDSYDMMAYVECGHTSNFCLPVCLKYIFTKVSYQPMNIWYHRYRTDAKKNIPFAFST